MIDLSLLNERQLEAVIDTNGVMRVVAGAGSGKTRVLAYRIAKLLDDGVLPSKILAITFTTKAAKEMRERVIGLAGETAEDVWLLTFHSLCFRILRKEILNIEGYNEHFSVYDEEDSEMLVSSAMESMGIDTKRNSPIYVCRWISFHKNILHTVERLKTVKWENGWDELCYSVYVEYQQRLLRNNAIDYDDLLLLTARLFIEHDDIRQKWRNRFDYLFVDEYQDTNYAQYILLRALFKENLCVVGDTDQSIYQFRGANPKMMDSFATDFPHCKTVKLEQNYRSTKTILNVANSVIKNNANRQEKVLWTENDVGSQVQCFSAGEARSEAKFIVETITELIMTGFSYEDIAVLYRMNHQSQALEKAFLKAHIPYVILGGIPFNRRKEVKDFLAYLRILVNPQDTVAMFRILRFPKRGIGEASLDKLTNYTYFSHESLYDTCLHLEQVSGLSMKVKKSISEVITFLEEIRVMKLSVKDLIKVLKKRLDYPNCLEALDKDPVSVKKRYARINLLQQLAKDFSTVSDFLDEVDGMEDEEDTTDKVRLMTMHAAKGLEFPVVFLPNLEEDIFPCSKATEEGFMDEERRLCYVAITRAMYKLFLSCSRFRFQAQYRKLEKRDVSRFLGEMPSDLIEYISNEKNEKSTA